jgi:hypothetical protein
MGGYSQWAECPEEADDAALMAPGALQKMAGYRKEEVC